MDVEDGNAANGDEKRPESGGYYLKRSDHQQHPHQNYMHSKSFMTITVLFVALTLSCFILYNSDPDLQDFLLSYSYRSLPTSTHPAPSVCSGIPVNVSSPTSSGERNFFSSPFSNQEDAEENKLERVLNRAATANKTVIITTLNAAWTAPGSIFDLFLESFKIGDQTRALLNHLVVVALDETAYFRCLELHHHCYALTTEGVDFSGQAHYMTAQYLKMMWRRLDFLRIVLETGYNFIFTDADIMWFRNPFSRFYLDTDFQIACDRYSFNSTNLKNAPNAGFKYAQSNNRTIQFYKFWYSSKYTYPDTNEQDVLNIIKHDPCIKKIGLSIRFLDTAYFGGFCQPSKDLNLVCTMHANCCIGLENKIHDLKMLVEDWRKYMELPIDQRRSHPPSWTHGRHC